MRSSSSVSIANFPQFPPTIGRSPLIAPIWLICLRGAGLYRSDNYVNPVKVTGRLLQAQVLAALLLLSAMYLTRSETISRLLIQCFLVVSFLMLTAQKLVLTGLLVRTRRRTPDHRRKVVLVAEPSRAVCPL
jgi:FlaA1/EpsC-like NDP-sugar epimerase